MILKLGILIFITLTLIERFVIPISDVVAIPLIILAIIFIIVGGIKTKQ